MKMRLTHNEKVTVKEAVREARQETRGCSPLLRLVALENVRDTLREDGIIISMNRLKKFAKVV